MPLINSPTKRAEVRRLRNEMRASLIARIAFANRLIAKYTAQLYELAAAERAERIIPILYKRKKP